MSLKLHSVTRRHIKTVFDSLDYDTLGPIYCDEGGAAFWRDRRPSCERLGVRLAATLKERLSQTGRSLYVGAGIAELPMMIMEAEELHRDVAAYNLREREVREMNRACHHLTLRIQTSPAEMAHGSFDHVWLVSVLNDPERFPELSALSYGRATPLHFQAQVFLQEREAVLTLTRQCLNKLRLPGLVTTSIEEIPWIVHWCEHHHLAYRVGERDYPTAIVGDPVCFIDIGSGEC